MAATSYQSHLQGSGYLNDLVEFQDIVYLDVIESCYFDAALQTRLDFTSVVFEVLQ